MILPFTRKTLLDWAGDRVLKDAELIVGDGRVLEAEYAPPFVKGAMVWNNRSIKTALKIEADGGIENQCPCRDNRERGIICSHIIAVCLALVKRHADPGREAKHRAELRHAARIASVDDSEYIAKVSSDTPGAIPAELVATLDHDWLSGFRSDAIRMSCRVEYGKGPVRMEDVPRNLPLAFSKRDENILFVIEDISQGPARTELTVNRFDFLNLLDLFSGGVLRVDGAATITVNATRLTTFLRMDMDRENGEIILMVHTEIPFLGAGEHPVYLLREKNGWVYGGGNLWPLENVLPSPYHAIYNDPIVVARKDVVRFIRRELPLLATHARIESDLNPDLFTIEPVAPSFRLVAKGSPASVSAALYAVYGGMSVPAGKQCAVEDFCVPDPDDLLRYGVRYPGKEALALDELIHLGFRDNKQNSQPGVQTEEGALVIVGEREVLNFFAAGMPMLRRAGWKVEIEGRVAQHLDSLDFVTPVVRVEGKGGAGWFDVSFNYECGSSQSLSPADIQRALRKGESFIRSGGRTILIDSEAVEAMGDVFADCSSEEADSPGHFRISNIYAGFVKSSLDALDGVDVEVAPQWRINADRQGRKLQIEQTPVGEKMSGILRPYQMDGVNWLRFLEKNGFCGLLADEMGLGKTVQTLAWLQLTRLNADADGKPALIVCPTSLVENWAEEMARFTPNLKPLLLSGPDRAEKFAAIGSSNVVITSYALLRRDIEKYMATTFSVAVLDEAQHIKNPTTQNAVATGRIKAAHRLVLTGTPLENSVTDLWSIMDFLMPGYLGSRDSFRLRYEQPIAKGGPDAETAQTRLRRKIHPFLMRRLKTEVARELPPKIRKIAFCQLTQDQKMVYTEILESSRRKIADMVSSVGFNKCRMEILAVLMRLRQTCCHLGLLNLPGLKAEYPSGKMDLFFELLDEALDSGHRMLVFSQFVSMLHILKAELEKKGLQYCYLDGSTKDRMSVVHRFNTERSIPLFLISLKAGGTGLNLTGADMVVHFDPWWNPAVEDQATDRAYRIGQKKTVYSIKLITKGTVEEKVLALQEKKRGVIDATLENEEKVMDSMTWDDIQELLSM